MSSYGWRMNELVELRTYMYISYKYNAKNENFEDEEAVFSHMLLFYLIP